MKRILTYVVFIGLLVITAYIAQITLKKIFRESARESVDYSEVTVTVSPVVRREFQDRINAVGTLKAIETCLLSPKVPGTVDKILVDLGDRVSTGKVVIRLDRTNFSLAVNQAEANFEQAEKEYRRTSNLLAEKVIPQSRFDAAEAAYKTSREALKIAREHLENAQIRSPIVGIVVERDVEIGQAVAPGVQVLRIVDQSSLKVDVDLPETDFGRIAVGIDARIAVNAFPGEVFSGKVTLVNPRVDRQTRTFRVRIEVPNRNGKMVDGMFTTVWLLAGERKALAVPRDALQRLPGSGTYYVFVVDGEKALKRTIATGVIGDQYTEILDGLAEGEKVVTSGAGRLQSGIRVNVQSGREGG